MSVATNSDTASKPSNPGLRKAAAVVGVIALIAIGITANFHFIWSADGPLILKKDHLSLSESFLSLNQVIDQPKDQPQRFPLAYSALVRDGYVKPLSQPIRGRKLSASDIKDKKQQIKKKATIHMLAHPVLRPAGWVGKGKGAHP